LKNDINAKTIADVEDDVLLLKFLEAGDLGRDIVCSDTQCRDDVLPSLIADVVENLTGCGVRYRN